MRLRSLFQRGRLESEFDEEIRFHMEQAAAAGVGPGEARRVFGNLTSIRQETRDMWGWNTLLSMLQDLRYAARGLRKSPGFALTAVLTLAAGIGASTALFTIVDSVLLRPLRYRDSGALVTVWQRATFMPEPAGPNPRFADAFRTRGTALSDLALAQPGSAGLSLGNGHPTLVGTIRATPNLFEILGVTPFRGSLFRPEHGVQGQDRVAVLTFAAWRQWFQQDPAVVGKTIRLRNEVREVVGVLPPDFVFPNSNELRPFSTGQAGGAAPEPAVFLPATLNVSQMGWMGEFGNWVAIGRTKPGVTAQQAQADLGRVQSQAMNEIPANQRGKIELQAVVTPMQEAIVGGARRRIWLLMASVLALLLIACLNLANTQLARSVSRSREGGVRAALGAPGWRLLWAAMSESLLLALIGGAAGVLLSFGALKLLRLQAFVDLPRLGEVEMNWFVLAVAMTLTLGSSLMFGLLPALRSLGGALSISSGARGTATAGARRAQTFLVAVQVFGCVVLLAITALFARSLLHLTTQDKGFETTDTAFAEASVAGPSYGDAAARAAFVDAVVEKLKAIPGVQSAAWGSAVPLRGETWVDGIQRSGGTQEAVINLRWVSPGYFDTNGHRLTAGRWLDDRDRVLDSIVISESTARVLWPAEDPVGRRARLQNKEWTVVGVVADSRSTSLKVAPVNIAYLPHTQARPTSMVFFARTAQRNSNLAASIREAIWSREPLATVIRSGSMEERVEDSLGAERFQTFLLLAFGGTALLLAMLGIYGVLSYSVAARQREIGVRMALGATRPAIYRLILGGASLPVLLGLGGGLAASWAAARLVESMLYGPARPDSGLMAAVSVLFLICASAAGFLPARRAATVDPMQSLRSE